MTGNMEWNLFINLSDLFEPMINIFQLSDDVHNTIL